MTKAFAKWRKKGGLLGPPYKEEEVLGGGWSRGGCSAVAVRAAAWGTRRASSPLGREQRVIGDDVQHHSIQPLHELLALADRFIYRPHQIQDSVKTT